MNKYNNLVIIRIFILFKPHDPVLRIRKKCMIFGGAR